MIHALPDDLERLFAFDPFFDNNHAMSGQDGEDDLTRVGRVPEGRRAREGLLDGAVLGVGGAGDGDSKDNFQAQRRIPRGLCRTHVRRDAHVASSG